MLLEARRPDLALHWLQAAADQHYPDAMHWLGRCHISGEGVPKDEMLGLSWLQRAAALGHVISQRQMAGIRVNVE
ncbi:Sel1 repeat-containing protein [Ectothiorhodospira magna]|uniref:Sel1 repeat-containing protein n=1 Tax=Ectothiorhodospira magna TaxID=867345 RepID=A0A1H9F9P3_9GAMM|nr:SEL1-like repeat protein [Ectothiorhodospira magna]SEQ34631.1 Sel1 repeat-containing protein [Ectothiorhodospira magna]